MEIAFPLGKLPVEGLRCPICGEEVFHGAQVARGQEQARALGLFGPQRSSTRKLRQTGTSLSVTLDPEILKIAVPGAKAGTPVEVGLEGDRIVIRRASS